MTATVQVELRRQAWSLPYQIDWAQVTQLQDVLQVVDGKWTWDAEIEIRPAEMGYDRALAVGDPTWTSYEVTAEITVHGIHPDSYKVKGSPGAGLGFNLHWTGHTDQQAKCDWPAQPHCGWRPIGALNWYSFRENGRIRSKSRLTRSMRTTHRYC